MNSIYAHYCDKPENAPGVPLDTEEAVYDFFDPALAGMITKDMDEARDRGDAPTLDGDPFVNSQEWKISACDIKVSLDSEGAAHATATFMNFDKNIQVDLSLTHLPEGWRIADIAYEGNGTLRDLYVAKDDF